MLALQLSYVHFVEGARQPIVDAPALTASHRVRPPIRFALQPEQNVLERSVVHLVLLQQFRFAHRRRRFALQLVDDGVLRRRG